ncbi:MAG TPA: S9 family peptidase [Flavihumibacter sp.]|nr:S9 family peptidase [Bacteroidota bacterium]HOA37541.1 S9 family peptidase [Flavihumibacter sp.]HQD08350.1 S9 family peptidase [Flavihumibacter sp.]
MKQVFFLLLAIFSAGIAPAQTKRPLAPADEYRLQEPGDIIASPDGNWVLYAVTKADSAKDKNVTTWWMTSWDGKESVQLSGDDLEMSSLKWSPDGKYISFTASRGTDKYDQLYLLDRRGGEGKRMTNIKGSIEDYNWSPDGSRIVFAIKDADFSDTASSKIRKPYVIDRYHFKQDHQGYLDSLATHLYLFTLSTKNLDTLTKGVYNESNAVFSPDGKKICFNSNRSDMPDKNDNSDLYVIDAKGGVMQQLTTWKGEDQHAVWSPDGKWIAYTQSSSDELYTMYGQNIVALIAATGGTPKLLSKSLDRPVRNVRWSADGQRLYFLVEDDREVQVGSVDINSGKLSIVNKGPKSFYEFESNKAKNAWVTTVSTTTTPPEIFALENGQLRQLTHLQDSFLAPLQLPVVEGFRSKSKDGTDVSGILYRPADGLNKKLPLILFIHGGPVAQDEFDFDLTRMIYAAAGYAVAAVNYRGSNGRGLDYIRAIYADWGQKEVVDIVGAADYLIAKGIVDENRMGIAGWSYGGISTNYTIATDQRFKAAVSGAGSSLQLSMYGNDQYVAQYEMELGYPWKNPEKWLAVSYPFFKADKIKTPTLFMASQSDFNVPVLGAEQMYQALKSLGVPTELVIYPKQFHGISVPSYKVDRLQRHINWFNKYLKY